MKTPKRIAVVFAATALAVGGTLAAVKLSPPGSLAEVPPSITSEAPEADTSNTRSPSDRSPTDLGWDSLSSVEEKISGTHSPEAVSATEAPSPVPAEDPVPDRSPESTPSQPQQLSSPIVVVPEQPSGASSSSASTQVEAPVTSSPIQMVEPEDQPAPSQSLPPVVNSPIEMVSPTPQPTETPALPESVTLTDISHAKLFVKNSLAPISFRLGHEVEGAPTMLVANGKSISVRAAADGTYEFYFPVGHLAGKQTVEITQLVIGGVACDCSASVVLDVRRDPCTISGVRMDGEALFWTLADRDNSFVELTVSVTDRSSGAVIASRTFKNQTENRLELRELTDGATYDVQFNGRYREDSLNTRIYSFTTSAVVSYVRKQDSSEGGFSSGVVPPAVPTNPPVVPTEPPVVPTNPPVAPTEPPVVPTEPPVTPTEPPVTPTEPPVTPEVPETPVEPDYSELVDSITLSQPDKVFGKNAELELLVSVTEGMGDIPLNYVVVDGVELEVSIRENGLYAASLSAGVTPGVQELAITAVNVADDVTVPLNVRLSYTVKKDEPTATVTPTGENGQYRLLISLVDPDQAVEAAVLILKDSSGEVIQRESCSVGETTLEVQVPPNEHITYQLSVSYRTAEAQSLVGLLHTGRLEGVQIDDEASAQSLDFKALRDVTLYKDGAVVDVVDSSALTEDAGKYYMEIQPLYAPRLYANVREFVLAEDGETVYAVADLEHFVMHKDGKEEEGFRHAFPYEANSTPDSNAAQAFFARIKAEPNGQFELTEDLDASQLELESGYVLNINFTGTLNGNGHTIQNLSGPLFNTVKGGTINDLVLKDASISGKKGFVADNINSKSVLDGVRIFDSTLNSTSVSSVGGMGGSINDSTIRNCAVIDCHISGNNTIGGIAGDLQRLSVVEGCVVQATISGTQSGNNNGTRGGGIAGWHNAEATIRNCFTDVSLSVPDKKGSGGIFGAPLSNAGTVSSSLAKVTANDRYSIGGADAAMSKVVGSYQMSSNPALNVGDGIETIDVYDESFLTQTLGISPELTALLKKDDALLGGAILREIPGYNAEREVAYHNMMMLAPLMAADEIVSHGNTLTGTLATCKVESIYPMDGEQQMVSVVDMDTAGSIRSIRVLFADKSHETYSVRADRVIHGMVDAYTMENGLSYHFRKYVLSDGLGLQSLVAEAAADYTYDADVSTAYSGNPIRQYRYVYEHDVAPHMDDFARMLVSSEYAYVSQDENLRNNLAEEIQANLSKLLYAYTYYKKSFDFDMGGVNVADLIFFDSEILSSELTLDELMDALSVNSRAIRDVYDAYTRNITKATGVGLYEQLELLLSMSGVDDYNQWFIDNWGGYVRVQEVIGYTPSPKLRYNIWDNLTAKTGVDCHLLNILTIPEELQPQIGIMSTASQILFSDVNLYSASPTEQNIQAFRNKIDRLSLCYGRYYGSSLNYVVNGEENLNNDLCIQFDTILKYANPAYRGKSPAENEAPMVMWLAEPAGRIYTGDAGAVATGSYVYYGYMYAVDAFGTFTHENAHNQDSDYFMNRLGRRVGNAEYYAEGFFTEPGNADGDFTLNRINEFGINDDQITALSYDRVNTADEIKDYYADLFDAWYSFNAVAAQAYINADLDARHRAGFVGYIENENLTDASQTTAYKYGPHKDELEAVTIQSFEDLWDNRFVYRPVGSDSSPYTRANFFDIPWWQPSNSYGHSDAPTFKIMGYELLGYAGWDEGLVSWASRRHGTDEEAIQAITGYDGMKEYKLARYDEAMSKISEIPYFDGNRLVQVVGKIFGEQNRGSATWGTSMKRVVIHAIKRVTDDFSDGDMYTLPTEHHYQVDNAADFIRIVNENSMKEGVYIELTGDLDFSDIVASNGHYANHFIGIINGNGHRITGLSQPLFSSARFSIFHNINFESTASNILIKNASANTSNHLMAFDCRFDADSGKLFGNLGYNDKVFALLNNEVN